VVADRADRASSCALAHRPPERHAKLVEGPYLHGFDALAEQLGRQLAAMPVRPPFVVLMFAVADTGIVDPDRLAAAAAEQIVNGLVRVLPQQVPERHVHCADGARLAAAVAEEIDRVEHILPVALDVEGAASQQKVGEHIVHHRADRARHVEGLAQPNQPVVGVDPYPGGIGLFVDPDCLQACDLHRHDHLFLGGKNSAVP